MGSQEESYGVGSPSRMGGWLLSPWPGLAQALLSLAEGLLQCRLGLGQQQLSGLPCWVSMRGLSCLGWHWVPPLL